MNGAGQRGLSPFKACLLGLLPLRTIAGAFLRGLLPLRTIAGVFLRGLSPFGRWARGGLSLLCVLMVGEVGAFTREQLVKAEPRVRAATEDLIEALQKGKMSPAEAAEESRIRASQTVSGAESYLLLQGAFRLFVQAGEYLRIVEVARHMQLRGFSSRSLVTLIEGALEPVPRGVDVGELEGYLRALKDDAARSQKVATERWVEAKLASRTSRGGQSPDETILDLLARVRTTSQKDRVLFRTIVRCPLGPNGEDGFPVLPPVGGTKATLADELAQGAASGGFTMRAHGRLRLLTRTEPLGTLKPIGDIFGAGKASETARQLKRIRIGFVAFDENEPLDEALERLFLTVSDYAAELDVDLILRSHPDGRFPLMRTARMSDTTLYDALDLACRSAGAAFEIRGGCVLVHPLR